MESYNQTENLFKPSVQPQQSQSNIIDQQFSVECYLALEAHMQEPFFVLGQGQAKEEIGQTPSHEIKSQITPQINGAPKKTSSVFHNFQKHIITLLRKICKFNASTFVSAESGKVALALWHAFLKIKSCSKKIFHIIFGFPSVVHLESELTLLAGQFKQFRVVKDKFGLEEIIRAQEILRKKVHERLEGASRQVLESLCRMENFTLFYGYILIFIEELRQGEVNKKISKKEVMQKIESLQSS